MKKQSLFFTVVLLIGLLAGCGQAQTRFQAGVHLAAGLLQGEFKQNTGNDGYGLTGEFLYAPPRSIFSVGVDIGFLIYGMETRHQPLSSEFPDIDVDVTTDNSMVLSHLLLRIQNREGRFRPYVEGVVGLNYLFTQTRIEDADDWNDDWDNDSFSTTNFDDTAFNYGAGGGLQWLVHKNTVALDLRARYLAGGEARYLKKGSIHREKGKVTYDVKESTTDMVLIQLGVCFNF